VQGYYELVSVGKGAMVDELHVLVDGLAFGEGPRWRDEHLWFSDMHDRLVKRVTLDGVVEDVAEIAGKPSGIGFLADGRPLVVSMEDRSLLRLEDGGPTLHADLRDYAEGPCNDMVVDATGRAYVGNFGFDMWNGAPHRPAAMIIVEPDGSARVGADDLSFPNGTVITPDGVLVVAESFATRLTAFDVAPDGSLSNRRVFAQLDIIPDGICLDAEGAIWVSSPLGTEVLRVRDGGEVAGRVPTGDRFSYACMLGGPDRRTLFVCTATTSDPNETAARRDGRVEVTRVDTPGAGYP
jgi:sugar lactone lactonase YvrE